MKNARKINVEAGCPLPLNARTLLLFSSLFLILSLYLRTTRLIVLNIGKLQPNPQCEIQPLIWLFLDLKYEKLFKQDFNKVKKQSESHFFRNYFIKLFYEKC